MKDDLDQFPLLTPTSGHIEGLFHRVQLTRPPRHYPTAPLPWRFSLRFKDVMLPEQGGITIYRGSDQNTFEALFARGATMPFKLSVGNGCLSLNQMTAKMPPQPVTFIVRFQCKKNSAGGFLLPGIRVERGKPAGRALDRLFFRAITAEGLRYEVVPHL